VVQPMGYHMTYTNTSSASGSGPSQPQTKNTGHQMTHTNTTSASGSASSQPQAKNTKDTKVDMRQNQPAAKPAMKMSDSMHAPGNEHLAREAQEKEKKKKEEKQKQKLNWADEPLDVVETKTLAQIQAEQRAEKAKGSGQKSQTQSHTQKLAVRTKGKDRFGPDGDHLYSVRPPMRARKDSFLGAGQSRGKALKEVEKLLGVVISHDYVPQEKFEVYAIPAGYEQWSDPKVVQKLDRAHEFLEYYVKYMAWQLDERVDELLRIDEVLQIWVDLKHAGPPKDNVDPEPAPTSLAKDDSGSETGSDDSDSEEDEEKETPGPSTVKPKETEETKETAEKGINPQKPKSFLDRMAERYGYNVEPPRTREEETPPPRKIYVDHYRYGVLTHIQDKHGMTQVAPVPTEPSNERSANAETEEKPVESAKAEEKVDDTPAGSTETEDKDEKKSVESAEAEETEEKPDESAKAEEKAGNTPAESAEADKHEAEEEAGPSSPSAASAPTSTSSEKKKKKKDKKGKGKEKATE
jgi:hypothetical protein